MIIYLKNANFASSNIGTLDSWRVSYSLSGGISQVDGECPGSVKKGSMLTAKFTLADGAEFTSASVSSGTAGALTHSVSEGIVTITVPNVQSAITVSVVASREEPETPVTPTSYTFTINPDPTSATVTLSATGYSTVSGTGSQSIAVADGTTVNWNVSADGYIARTGNWTADGENKIESIVLIAAGDSGERVIIAEKADYSINGFCRPTNGTFGGTTETSYKRTDYIDITAYSALYAYCQPRAASVSPISFFTADKTWISGITPGGTLTEQQEFAVETIPENAVYAIFSGFSGSTTLKAEGILK